MKAQQLMTLKQIALSGGSHDFVVVSSRELGRSLGVSQQSASKRILDLLEQGYVTRDLAVRRQRIRLTAKGVDVLRKEYADYRRLYENSEKVRIRGILAAGLGEGRYYIQLKGYQTQLQKKLGFDPYPGTLNLKIFGNEAAKLAFLQDRDGTPIKGFVDQGRTFGDAKCFPAEIRGVEGAVILPVRTHHRDTLEVISKVHLRTKLGLEDGDVVEVEVRL